MLKNVDIFPANPKWSIEGKEFGSTWKTFILTLAVLGASIFMSYNNLSQLWISKANLTLTQTSLTGGGQPVSPFVIGIRFNISSYYQYLNLVYTNGDRPTKMDNCPDSLSSIDSQMVCYQIRPCTFSSNDSFYMYRNNTGGGSSMTVYSQLFSSKLRLNDQPMTFLPINIPGDLAWVNISLTKQKLVLSDSLIPGASTESFVGLNYAVGVTISVTPTTRHSVRFVFDEASKNMAVFTASRQTFPTILASVISNIQLLTGIVGILMLLINSLYLKVELAKLLYNNAEVQKVLVSYLFTIRYALLQGLTMIKLHRPILRRGWLRSEFVCSKAFDDMDVKMSVENVLKVIQTLRQNKLADKPTPQPKEGAVSTFEYNLALQTENIAADVQTPTRDKLPSSRSGSKKSWFGNFLRSMEASPIVIEFNVEKEEKSSILSIIFTYIGTGGLIFLLIYLNSFSLDAEVNSYSMFDNSTTIYNSTLQPLVLTARRTTTKVAYPALSTLNITMFVNDELNNNYAFQQNCSRKDPLVPTRQYGMCLNDNPSISPSSDLVINVSRAVPNGWTIQVELGIVDFFMRSDGVVNRYTQLNNVQFPGDPATTLLVNLEKIVIVDNGVRSQYFRVASSMPYRTSSPKTNDWFAIRLRVSDKIRVRTITNVTIGDIFIRIWGLNLIFFIVMALYISKPYNRRIAKKLLGSKFTEDPKLELEKGQELLRINNLLLYLRSKMETIDENLFFKESINMSPPAPESSPDSQPQINQSLLKKQQEEQPQQTPPSRPQEIPQPILIQVAPAAEQPPEKTEEQH